MISYKNFLIEGRSIKNIFSDVRMTEKLFRAVLSPTKNSEVFWKYICKDHPELCTRTPPISQEEKFKIMFSYIPKWFEEYITKEFQTGIEETFGISSVQKIVNNLLFSYGEWAAKEIIKNQIPLEDLQKLGTYIYLFDINKQKLQNKNILSYSFQQIKELAVKLKNRSTEITLEITQDVIDAINEDIRAKNIELEYPNKITLSTPYYIIKPNNHAASRKYGCGSEWCTTYESSQNFDSYMRASFDGLHILIINGDTKFQYHYDDYGLTLMDVKDDPVDIIEFTDDYPFMLEHFNSEYLGVVTVCRLYPEKAIKRMEKLLIDDKYSISGDIAKRRVNLNKIDDDSFVHYVEIVDDGYIEDYDFGKEDYQFLVEVLNIESEVINYVSNNYETNIEELNLSKSISILLGNSDELIDELDTVYRQTVETSTFNEIYKTVKEYIEKYLKVGLWDLPTAYFPCEMKSIDDVYVNVSIKELVNVINKSGLTSDEDLSSDIDYVFHNGRNYIEFPDNIGAEFDPKIAKEYRDEITLV